MKCNIEPIASAVKKLYLSTNQLSSSIVGDWNDEVKDSYRKYISQCNENINKIRDIELKMKLECENLSNIDVKSLVDSAESTCFAIDGV